MKYFFGYRQTGQRVEIHRQLRLGLGRGINDRFRFRRGLPGLVLRRRLHCLGFLTTRQAQSHTDEYHTYPFIPKESRFQIDTPQIIHPYSYFTMTQKLFAIGGKNLQPVKKQAVLRI
ncbi:hypothetical protein SDC9_183434 [bioreactor metagenome]|uniref:Uncharacterized protein n=1 Tax=bioreactor metagenome TaxID=1076179 RepID=A0A645HCS8_9ZZZZ